MDWSAAISSEVFRNYVSNQLAKEASENKTAEQELMDEAKIMEEFDNLQKRINESPKLKAGFKKLQDIFLKNAEYKETVDPKFVEGILLLEIDEKDE